MSLDKIKTALQDIIELNQVTLGVEFCKVLEIDTENKQCTVKSMINDNIFTNVRYSTITKIDDVEKGTTTIPTINSNVYVLRLNEYDNILLSTSELQSFEQQIGNLSFVFNYDDDTGDSTYYIEYNKENDFSGMYLNNNASSITSGADDKNSRVYLKDNLVRVESNMTGHTTIVELNENGVRIENDGFNLKDAFTELKTQLLALTVTAAGSPSSTPINGTAIGIAMDKIINILN